MSSRKIYYIKKRTWRPKKTCSFELDEDGLPLNEMAWGQTEESPSAEGGPQRDSWWTRMLSVILIIAFSGVMILTTLPLQHIPLIDLAVQSLHIKENMNQTLINAVVKIEVIAPNAKGSLGVYQKNGSGFNISPEGIIVTNYHVIENGLSTGS